MSSQQQDNTFLHWIIGGDVSTAQAMPSGVTEHHPVLADSVLPHQPLPFPPPQPLMFHPSMDIAVTRHQPTAAVLKPTKPEEDDTAAAVGQLAEAAELAEAGDVLGSRAILARLNNRFPAAPTAGTPLHRCAFYFKEALRVALSTTTGDAPTAPTPVDVLLKIGAYKAFSEVSPVVQFAHFTCVQAVLDELGGAGCIHVLDFEIGVGDQWASLMQELAQRRPGTSLKVTALVSTPSSSPHHRRPLELQLVQENLSSFAADARVPFQFAVFSLESTDPTEILAMAAGDAIAVHLPVGCSVHTPAMPSILHLVRRLGAKLVVTVDRSCDRRSELPFAAHLFQAFQSCVFLLESLDAVGSTDSDKIERLLIQPRIESCVVSKYRGAIAGDRTPPWRALLASAGFVPVQASSFAEAQAASLLKKVPVRGFRVEKRAGSLLLHWQRGELVSVTTWRC